MKDLIENLDILSADKIGTEIVVEQCSVYDAVLSKYCVVCKEYNVPAVEGWIKDNIKSSVDHCLRMFAKKPESIMKFIVASKNAKSLTEEFVKACGGVQGFLDKYAREDDTQLKEITAFGTDTEDKTEKQEASGTKEEQDAPGESVNAEDSEITETIPGFNGSADALAAAMQTVEAMENLEEESSVENSSAPEAADYPEEEENIENIERPLTADEQLQKMLELQRKEDAIRNGTFQDEPEDAAVEPVTTISVDAVEEKAPFSVQNKVSMRELADSLFDDTGEFVGFTEDQTIAVMKVLKRIDPQIRLGGLDPGNILSKEEMLASVNILQSFSPGVFKRFMLYEVENASSDYELIRVTTMLDDFCNFINKEFGGRQ